MLKPTISLPRNSALLQRAGLSPSRSRVGVRAAQQASLPFPFPPLPPLPSSLTAAQYASAMSLRVAYFVGQATLNSTLNNSAGKIDVGAIAGTTLKVLSGQESAADFKGSRVSDPAAPTEDSSFWTGVFKPLLLMLQEDLGNVERGVYPMPYDLVPSPASPQWNPLSVLSSALDYMSDQRLVAERRAARRGTEVREALSEEEKARYPPYYLQNFHFQTGGWFSAESSQRYDYQVETLFFGTADAMRRAALPYLVSHIEGLRGQGRDTSSLQMLDVATGTGRWLSFVKQKYPELRVTALDLSAPYLNTARSLLAPYGDTVRYVEAPAEAVPLPDASQDVVTCVFTFHELPPPVRRQVAAEMSRALRPGGLLLLVDSAQGGDMGDAVDAALGLFPERYHEPFYKTWLTEDVPALFPGLDPIDTKMAWVSKVFAYRKPLSAPPPSELQEGGLIVEEVEGF